MFILNGKRRRKHQAEPVKFLREKKPHDMYILANQVLRLYNKNKKTVEDKDKSHCFIHAMKTVFHNHFSDKKIYNRWNSFEYFIHDISPECKKIQPTKSEIKKMLEEEKQEYASIIIEEIQTLSEIKGQFLDSKEALLVAIHATCDREKNTSLRRKFWKKVTEFRKYFENYFFPPKTQNPATL